ncbi:MAG: hypothetical protein RR493_07240 [Erysipelotrichaceae bacterium]
MTIQKIVLTNSKVLYANFWILAEAFATALLVFVCIMQRKEDEETKEDAPQ